MTKRRQHGFVRFLKGVAHWSVVFVGAFGLTLMLFLVLPLIQTISKPPAADMMVTSINTVLPPPPPPPPEEDEPEEEEPEEKPPPELEEEVKPLDLAQLEVAMGESFGAGLAADFTVDLGESAAGGGGVDALFSMAELDQRPRAIYQPSPNVTPALRKRAPGTVSIIFIVNTRGRVEHPIVQNSTDPVFEAPALSAVKQWKFEPGMRNGQPVRFRMRVPITFPEK